MIYIKLRELFLHFFVGEGYEERNAGVNSIGNMIASTPLDVAFARGNGLRISPRRWIIEFSLKRLCTCLNEFKYVCLLKI